MSSRLISRIIAPGVIVTLHGTPAGMNGSNELCRSGFLNASVFAESTYGATNTDLIELPATAQGTARYIAIWIEGEIHARGSLRDAVDVESGDVPYFERGDLLLRLNTYNG